MPNKVEHLTEVERRRLAQALHDHLQQFLIAAKFSADHLISLARKDALHPEKAAPLAEAIRENLIQAIETSRAVSREICPPELYELKDEVSLNPL